MNIEEIRKKAKPLGIKTFGIKKEVLIREIQAREGNFSCFGTAGEYCDRWDCCFRDDCLKKNA